MSLNELKTDALDFELNENIEGLLELQEEVILIIDMIRLELMDITNIKEKELVTREKNCHHLLLWDIWNKIHNVLSRINV